MTGPGWGRSVSFHDLTQSWSYLLPVAWPKKVKESNIHMFTMSVAALQIHEELYTPLISCYCCYAVEEHVTNQCPALLTYTVCSECVSKEHTFHDCKAVEMKCLNCELEHNVHKPWDVQSEKRRQRTKKVRKEQTHGTPTTPYAQAASQGQSDATASMNCKGLICLLYAHMVECAASGSFQKNLSEALSLNSIPNIKLLPGNLPSSLQAYHMSYGWGHSIWSSKNFQKRPQCLKWDASSSSSDQGSFTEDPPREIYRRQRERRSLT